MSVTLTLPEGYAYAGTAIMSTFWLTFWQTTRVGRARVKAGIKYPQAYAEVAEAAASPEAHKFNCAQRAHQNTLEFLPMIITSTAVAALKYPIVAASLCGAWVFFRVFYTIGYCSGEASKRNKFGGAMFSAMSAVGLLGTATFTAVKLIFA
ncbi:membrane-associated proteins in eicosanoid and glutathione metabolism [Abortiporus biennis]|nr:membrane-associated proteins in eicosanoid and glutathione metabolism [Abortiporus biennis]